MNLNRALLIYTALVASGILFSSVRGSFSPDPTNRLSHDLSEVKQTVDRMNQRFATEEGKLTQEVNSLKSQIAASENQPEPSSNPKTAILGTSQSLGQIKVTLGYDSLDIYEDVSFSSPVAGKLDPEKTYSYTKKQDNWLLVKIDDNKEGWVNSKLVTIVDAQGSP